MEEEDRRRRARGWASWLLTMQEVEQARARHHLLSCLFPQSTTGHGWQNNDNLHTNNRPATILNAVASAV
ncbi:UNVERIFIED_CONTAM: hypothetical protein HHA_451070 [Hammondia hammondi]|eukprot:XP_008883623.1 hypothetical protein HHA_451070 [Hammondia hammondi]